MQARKQWSQYMSIVTRIQNEIANGKTASMAIEALDNERASRTLPQLQVALRPKGQKSTKKAIEMAPVVVAESMGSAVATAMCASTSATLHGIQALSPGTVIPLPS
jgi:hypothetical protein